MVSTRVVTGLAIVAALAAAPVSADQGRRRNGNGDRERDQQVEQGDRRERAVPRARQQQNDQQSNDVRESPPPRQVEGPRRNEAPPQYDSQPQYDSRQRDVRHNDGYRAYRPAYPSYGHGYGYGRPVVVPRVIYPRVVTVVPYRPYVYRPSLSIGVYYGTGGSYPYGYVPRGYYDPIPGRPYGGLRITGAPRYAHVFADGYYVGIVNDFDGIFQHLNLEAGPHRIEIEAPEFQTIAFDVFVEPDRTMTYRVPGF
jgi:hypothetical protein